MSLDNTHIIRGCNGNELTLSQLLALPVRAQFKNAIHDGSTELFCFLKAQSPIESWVYKYIGQYNQTHLLEKLDEKANVKRVFEGACLGGHIDLALSMINQGAHHWKRGMYYACRGGHPYMVELIIENGLHKWMDSELKASKLPLDDPDYIEDPTYKRRHKWDRGLCGACRGGHKELIEMMISKGARNYERALDYACRGRQLEIVKLMLRNVDITTGCLDYALMGACQGGDINIVQLLIDTSKSKSIHRQQQQMDEEEEDEEENEEECACSIEIEWGFESACEHNQCHLFQLLIDNGAEECDACGDSMEEHLERCK